MSKKQNSAEPKKTSFAAQEKESPALHQELSDPTPKRDLLTATGAECSPDPPPGLACPNASPSAPLTSRKAVSSHASVVKPAAVMRAARLGAAIVLVHHTTKGAQAGKSVTDIGAGGGAQSRAADTHLVARYDEKKLEVRKRNKAAIRKAFNLATDETARDIQQFVKSRIAPYKYPRWIEFAAELPKTATGKIQRFRLRALSH